jgi:hypothetical protein
MSGFPVLDVVIGLAFLYLLFALSCTTLNEVIAGLFDRRATMLRGAIDHLLGDKDLAQSVYQHPAIVSLAKPSKKSGSKPSYIPGDRFAAVLMDRLTAANPATDAKALKDGIAKQAPIICQQMQLLYDFSKGDPDEFRARVAEWYEEAMDRVSGWYKRSVQRQTYVMAIAVVVLLNLDSVALFNRLWSDSAFRTTVVEQAKARVEATGTAEVPVMEYTEGDKPDAGTPVQTGTASLTDSEKQLLASLGGWKEDFGRLNAARVLRGEKLSVCLTWLGDTILHHLLGWLITILAISLGAPFWFDVLNKFMNLRNAGRATDEARSKA